MYEDEIEIIEFKNKISSCDANFSIKKGYDVVFDTLTVNREFDAKQKKELVF